MIAVLAWLAVLAVAVPVLTFALECAAGAAPGSGGDDAGVPPPFAVLVPAHDEAAGIGITIARAQAQLRPSDRLLVVADNCTDDTAAVARALGAEVVERHDPVARGKGFALAAGRAALAAAPPAVVIVLDADCWAEPGTLPRLAALAGNRGMAIQGRNLLAAEPDAAPAVQLSNFAFVIKNLVRQRGLQRLGAPVLLQGTGMALPWPMFATARLATGSLAEDLELGLELVLAGRSVGFAADAGVNSPATSGGAAITQRTRWEHGTINAGWHAAPALLGAALRGRPALLPLALNVIVPPLALLAVLQLGAMIVAGVALLTVGTAGPLLTAVATSAMFGAAVIAAWLSAGREFLRPAAIWRIPGYIFWKLPIYRRLLAGRQRTWIRTSRDA